jgi:hypothetical protein
VHKKQNGLSLNQRAFGSAVESADFLDTSVSQIYKHINNGKLTAVKQGRSTKVTTESLFALAREIASQPYKKTALRPIRTRVAQAAAR